MTTTAPADSGVRIRRAERADLLDVFRIEKASFAQPWPYGAFERFLDEPGFLVAARGTTVGGYVVADVVANHGQSIGHVKDLAVAPDWRERGVGSRLLDRALSTLAARGARRAKLELREGNDAARRLYDRFGFDRHHTVPGYYADGDDAHVLVADIGDR